MQEQHVLLVTIRTFRSINFMSVNNQVYVRYKFCYQRLKALSSIRILQNFLNNCMINKICSTKHVQLQCKIFEAVIINDEFYIWLGLLIPKMCYQKTTNDQLYVV